MGGCLRSVIKNLMSIKEDKSADENAARLKKDDIWLSNTTVYVT